MGVRLPPEYQEVEYIESTGTQYINTGIQGSNNNDITAKFSAVQASLSNGNVVSASPETPGTYGGRTQFRYAENVFCGWGAGYQNNIATVVDEDVHTLRMNKNTFKLDGNTIYTPISTTFNRTVALHLFCTYVYSSGAIAPANFAVGLRIHQFAINNNGSNQPVINLIPCYRKSDNKTGMYDFASGEFLTNAGTGEFLVGPDVIDSISPWLMGRRRLLMQTAEHWTYVLTQKYSAGSAKLKPKLIQITEGQTVVIAWGGCSSFGFTPRVWALKDGAKFNETNSDDLATKYLSADGEHTYTVKTSGGLVLAGLNTTGTVSAYLYQGDYVKARIT